MPSPVAQAYVLFPFPFLYSLQLAAYEPSAHVLPETSLPTMDCVRQDVPEYQVPQAYVQFPGAVEYVQAVAVADGFPTVRAQRFEKDGLAAQDPRDAVQVGEAAPFQSPSQVQVVEAPAAGNAGDECAVPCPQSASAQKEVSRKEYVLAAVPQVPGTEALQEEVPESQPNPELQSQVQSPAVAERAQFPDTDCEVAVECAFASAIVPPQTSCTQESAAPSTHPETHDTETSDTVTEAKEQDAFPDFVPIVRPVQERIGLETEEEAPCARTGTTYPLTVHEAQPAEVPAFPPSTRASVEPGAFTRPTTDQEEAG